MKKNWFDYVAIKALAKEINSDPETLVMQLAPTFDRMIENFIEHQIERATIHEERKDSDIKPVSSEYTIYSVKSDISPSVREFLPVISKQAWLATEPIIPNHPLPLDIVIPLSREKKTILVLSTAQFKYSRAVLVANTTTPKANRIALQNNLRELTANWEENGAPLDRWAKTRISAAIPNRVVIKNARLAYGYFPVAANILCPPGNKCYLDFDNYPVAPPLNKGMESDYFLDLSIVGQYFKAPLINMLTEGHTKTLVHRSKSSGAVYFVMVSGNSLLVHELTNNKDR